ncbi:MAG TPA: class IV adenylate cyclase [Gemmatimonadaceae bacterium]|nr:class IV adenylate cyclase [Gemmatimonadaceae bacterium]
MTPEAHAEWELKAVVPDWTALRARLESSGATLEFEGRLEDRRYDTPADDLSVRDHVLRLRIYRDAAGRVARASLDWKGPTEYRGGYKVREERSTSVGDPDAMATVLERLEYRVAVAIDRAIVQYALRGASVRLERYPRMDDLVEVEGTADSIEAAIRATGLSREAFTADALAGFIARFEARTGVAAAVSDAELTLAERRHA